MVTVESLKDQFWESVLKRYEIVNKGRFYALLNKIPSFPEVNPESADLREHHLGLEGNLVLALKYTGTERIGKPLSLPGPIRIRSRTPKADAEQERRDLLAKRVFGEIGNLTGEKFARVYAALFEPQVFGICPGIGKFVVVLYEGEKSDGK